MFLKEWFNNYISNNNNNIIVFDNGNIRLDVKIEPEKDTVWLSTNQMAELFETTLRNRPFRLNLNLIILDRQLSLSC